MREVFFYKNYYLEFYNTLDKKVQIKFNWTLELIEKEIRVPEKYLKHLTDTNGLYEIRVEFRRNNYRVFCFFDERALIILINGFIKKKRKTPKREIEFVQKLKKEYYNEK